MHGFLSKASALARDERGVSSVEFAFFAPVLIAAALTMLDVGMAVAQRMEMDRNVRAGAQAAMTLNNDDDAIRAIVLASAGSPDTLDVAVSTGCFCSTQVAVCTAMCASGDAPSVFVDISASQAFEGLLAQYVLPDLTLDAATRVQIR